MNSVKTMITGLIIMLATVSPALAVDTTRTYSSGLLVGLFIGFCALIVMFQLVPTIIMLVGFVKGMFKSTQKQARRHGSKA